MAKETFYNHEDLVFTVVEGVNWRRQKQRTDWEIWECQASNEKIRYRAERFVFANGKKHQKVSQGSHYTQ